MAHDLLYQDDTLQATFFGNLTAVPNPPSRLVNIFVSSSKTDWELERRQLHDVVVPQLQRDWSSIGVDIQLVDIQSGGGEDAIFEPQAIAGHLKDIEDCHNTSLGCFFLCLIGNKYRPYPLPASIDASDYTHIRNAASEAGLDASLLDNHYQLDTNLLPPKYVLQQSLPCRTNGTTGIKEPLNKLQSEDSEDSNWPEEEDKLVRILQYGARIATQEGLVEAEEKSHPFILSGVHTHLQQALKLCKGDTSRVMCIVRQFEDLNPSDPSAAQYFDCPIPDVVTSDDDSALGLQNLIDDVIMNVDKKNVSYFKYI